MRSAVKSKEAGVVLLTTLLVMSLMAVVAVAMIDDVRYGVKRASNVQAHAQAKWYALAAEDFAQTYLDEVIVNSDAKALNALFTKTQTIVLPLDDSGHITLNVRDGSQCISLGDLNGSAGRIRFRRLLNALGEAAINASNLASVAADWQDADGQTLPGGAEDFAYLGQATPYRTANTSFNSVMEMRALSGMSPALYSRLAGFMCARKPGVKPTVNVNTLAPAQAPLLAALLGSDQLAVAQSLISQRPTGGYDTLEAFLAAPALAGIAVKNFDIAALGFSPAHIWVEAEIVYQGTNRFMALDFDVSIASAVRLSRSFNNETRRPVFTDLNPNGTSYE